MKRILVVAAFLAVCCMAQPAFAAAGTATKTPDEKALKKMLTDFEAYAVQGMKDWQIPGMAVAIVKGDTVIYQKTFGVKKLGTADPVTPNTIFQIGSTSKAFTAALVAMMVDEGKAKWDGRVADYLDDFSMYDPWVQKEFEIWDLMAQHSGMPAHGGDGAVMVGFDRAKLRYNLRYIEPVSSFRAKFAYQNNLFLIAAELVEKLTGKSYETNLKERIFDPLGMKASSGDLASYQNSKDVATLHHTIGDKIVILPMDWPSIDWSYTFCPAGGINSNIVDMTKWLRLHINNGTFGGKKIISAEGMDFMHSPKTIAPPLPGQPDQYYCQGWIFRDARPYSIIWHNGGTSGSKTMIAFVPQAKLGVVVLSNLIENKLVEALAFRFFDMYLGNELRDWSKEDLERTKKEAAEAKANEPKRPAVTRSPLPLEKYAGDYHSDLYGTVTVAKEGDSLTLTIGPKKMKMTLKSWDADKFLASWKMFVEPEDNGLVSFDLSPEGVPTQLCMDAFAEEGGGIFKKVEKK